jgi:hypothetical protein
LKRTALLRMRMRDERDARRRLGRRVDDGLDRAGGSGNDLTLGS